MVKSVYFSFMKKAFQQKYIYRSDSYIYIFTSLLSFFVQISIWFALYSGKESVNGITLPDMMNYVIINLIVSSFTRSNMGNRLATKVSDGSIEADFVRPVNFKYYFIFEQIGENLFYTVFGTIPICIIAALFLQFKFSIDVIKLLLFFISLFNGIILIYFINYTFGLLSFWFKTALYATWYIRACFDLFGGTFVPLWFYPSFLLKISSYLPFRLISFEPISIYLGKYTNAESLQIILLQLFWIVVFLLIEKVIWARAQKIITIQGG